MNRGITIRTGAVGYELFQIAMEETGMGKKRFFLPKKMARIFKIGDIRKDRRGREYKLVKKSL